MIVEWNQEKALKNRRKHGVSFHQAITVLEDPLSTTYRDPDHSVKERRYVTFGESADGRILVVAHADRRGAVRIISARRATPRERKHYEEDE